MSVCTSIGHHASVQDKENERLRQIIRERDVQIEVLQQAHISSIEILSSNFSRLENIVNEFCELLNDASRCRPTLPEDDIRLQLLRTMSVAQLQNKRLRQRIAKWRSFVESGADDWFGSPESIMVLVDHKELLRDIDPHNRPPVSELHHNSDGPTIRDKDSSESLRDDSITTVSTTSSRNNSSATSDTSSNSPKRLIANMSLSPEPPTQLPLKTNVTARSSSLTSLSLPSAIPATEPMETKRQNPQQSRSATTRMITSLKKSISRRGGSVRIKG
ncbi:hypothetical protein BGW37DRAFT_474759 [Umbelopsis sp. PMI_123]|nr:hypothetical protein BGW37DRAFT_474759 [Umbelopsis sp. PMI_123]